MDNRTHERTLFASCNMGTMKLFKSIRDKAPKTTLTKEHEAETETPTVPTSSSGGVLLSKVFSNAPQSSFETRKSAETHDLISQDPTPKGTNRGGPGTRSLVQPIPKENITLPSQNEVREQIGEHDAAGATSQQGNISGNSQEPKNQVAQVSEKRRADGIGNGGNWDWRKEYQKLQDKNRELQRTSAILADEKQVLIGEKLSLQSGNQTINNALSRAEAIVEEKVQTCNSLSKKLQESERIMAETLDSKQALLKGNQAWSEAFDGYQKELRDEKTKVAALQDDKKDLNQKRQKLAGQLAKYNSEAGSSADDEFFENEWAKLDKLIINWSRAYFEGRSRRQETHNDHERLKDMHHFRQIAPEPYEYLDAKTNMPYFTQSFVWSVLVDRIFAYPGRDAGRHLSGLYWSRRHRDSLDALSGFLYPDISRADDSHDSHTEIRNYMKWRASTAQLMLKRLNRSPDKDISIDPALLEEQVEYILKHIQHWRKAKDDGDCKQNLRNILRSAVKLDTNMSRHWALLVACHNWNRTTDGSLHGAPFDHSIMTLRGEDRSMKHAKVKLVLTPALVRYGTAEGESYHIPTVIRRAEVQVEIDTFDVEDEFERSRTTTSGEVSRRSKGVVGWVNGR